MASPTLITPCTSKSQTPFIPLKPKSTISAAATATTVRRRDFLSLTASVLAPSWVLFPQSPALASSDDEYVKDTSEVIGKVRMTITMDRNDPNVAAAVAELRESSNFWVAKYRKEKALLGRASFRDMYSALNAVSGHYISFGPTAPIPAKRKARILEEMDTAEKALLRGR
ncbi:photosystem II repair protein PSB27-H1, chloroplastic [Benincasa hispida]|uniref:photosystem II repair protein PSB27-H1, chloroplastic n=1 Tax=Benincasa hispida TaxID=102211 RepID=UPI0019008517|nr:photosystem II repair protein PSB27-H1, chloroplastic [Benincasa hispida]